MAKCIGGGRAWCEYEDFILQNGVSSNCGCDDVRCFDNLKTGSTGPVGHDTNGCLIEWQSCVDKSNVALYSKRVCATFADAGVCPFPATADFETSSTFTITETFTAAMTLVSMPTVRQLVASVNGSSYPHGGIFRVKVDGTVALPGGIKRGISSPVSAEFHVSHDSGIFTVPAGTHVLTLEFVRQDFQQELCWNLFGWRTAC